jgi:hypothetical protein
MPEMSEPNQGTRARGGRGQSRARQTAMRVLHCWARSGGSMSTSIDHVWVYNRPRTLTTDEAGLEGPIAGAKDAEGQPVNGMGQPRPYGPVSDCCQAAHPFWSSMPAASCCKPGAARPIPVSSEVNARRRQAAYKTSASVVHSPTAASITNPTRPTTSTASSKPPITKPTRPLRTSFTCSTPPDVARRLLQSFCL